MMTIIWIAILIVVGVVLVSQPHPFRLLLGFSAFGHAANLLIIVLGDLKQNSPAIIDPQNSSQVLAEPLSQALVLTAIVIGLGVQLLLLAIIVWGNRRAELQSLEKLETIE